MRGFTLVEVLIALSFLSIAILGFHQGQSGSIRLAKRAESKAQAIALAQMQMTETELLVQKKGFQSFGDSEKGEFKEEFSKFKWERKLTKVNLGCFMPTPKTDDNSGQAGFFELAQKFFESAVRKIEISVDWEEAGKIQKVTLTQLYVRFEDLPPI